MKATPEPGVSKIPFARLILSGSFLELSSGVDSVPGILPQGHSQIWLIQGELIYKKINQKGADGC